MKPQKVDEHAPKSLPARTDSEAVGYGRPPKEHQFKKGKSGNPRGRRPGAKNQATILHEILFRMIPIRDRGKVRKVPVIEAMLLKFAEEALRGNPKAAAFLLSRYGLSDQNDISPTEITRDEEDILNAFVQRIQTRRGDNT